MSQQAQILGKIASLDQQIAQLRVSSAKSPMMRMEKKTKVLGPTILTGTSEVDIGGSGVTLSSPFDGIIKAVQVIAQRGGVATVAESDTVVIRLKSNMMNIVPFEVLGQPVNAGISTDIMGYREEAPWIPVNCPTHKGDLLQITGAEQTACTVHPYVTVTVLYADVAVGEPQLKSQIGTKTATTTAAGESAVNTINIGAGYKAIKRIYAYTVDTTIASGKGILGKIRITSNQFSKGGDIEFGVEGVPGTLAGATGSSITRLTKLEDIDVGIEGQTILNAYFNLGLAITTAGNWNLQVMYMA